MDVAYAHGRGRGRGQMNVGRRGACLPSALGLDVVLAPAPPLSHKIGHSLLGVRVRGAEGGVTWLACFSCQIEGRKGMVCHQGLVEVRAVVS